MVQCYLLSHHWRTMVTCKGLMGRESHVCLVDEERHVDWMDRHLQMGLMGRQ